MRENILTIEEMTDPAEIARLRESRFAFRANAD